MDRLLLMPCVIAGLLVSQPTAGQKQKAEAGWPDVFPAALTMYQQTFQAPVVEGDAKNPVYRQTALYDWTGNADRHLKVTVARNAEFKKTYSEEAVQKSQPPGKKKEIGKYAAWEWKFERNDTKDTPPLHERLVILLGDDRVVIIEESGLGPFGGDIRNLLEKMDLERISKALDKAPSR
jgi:hypothetical protein